MDIGGIVKGGLSVAVAVCMLTPVVSLGETLDAPPVIENVTAHPATAWQEEDVTIRCDVTDDGTVATVKAVITFPDGQSQINMSMARVGYTSRYEYTQRYTEPGVYTYHIWAADNSSNANRSANHSFQVKEDDVPPDTYASLAGTRGNSSWYVSNVTVSMYACDTGMGVDYITYMLDGAPWLHYHAPFSVTGDGVHSLYYYAVDEAGNEETPRHSTIQIDTACPSTVCDLSGVQGSQGWYISNVSVMLDATDPTSGVNATFYRLDGGDWQEYEGAFTVSDDTRHTLEFYSADVAGNREPSNNVSFKIDKIRPTVTITTPRAGYLYIQGREIVPTFTGNTVVIGPITIAAQASNHESGIHRVAFYVDNELQIEDDQGPYQWTWDYLSMGTHVVRATAYDNAGQHRSDEIIIKIFNL